MLYQTALKISTEMIAEEKSQTIYELLLTGK